MIETRTGNLLPLVNRLADSAGRPDVVRELSAQLGIATFLFFLSDPELGTPLTAPGFPQTLPGGKAWRAFVQECGERGRVDAELPWPDRDSRARAIGISSAGGFVLVLVGGEPKEAAVAQLTSLLPLLGAIFQAQQVLQNQQVQIGFSRQIARQATELATTLDEARRAAEREIAARKQAQEKVRLLNETLEQRVVERTAALQEAVLQIEEFSYSVSHDLRTPVRAIQGFAHILQSDFGERLGEDGAAYLDRIINAGTRLEALTSDVLSYARVARAEMELERIDLDALVGPILEERRDGVREADLLAEFPLLPVIAHPTLLGRCLANLIDNAVKFVPQGSRPRICISTVQRDDGRVRVQVRDNGIGIPQEHQAKIFNMFERLNRREHGTGIGLAIVRKAAERMGGRVGVMSAPGEGSTFWIELRNG